MNIVPQHAMLVTVTPHPIEVIEAAGRICYQSEPKGDPEGFVRMLIRRGHESVLEHASLGFRFVTDRGITHELVRHRIASFSQESTRYCNYSSGKFSNAITVIQPPHLTPQQRAIWQLGIEQAENRYFAMLEAGCSPQIARSVLPTCTKSEIAMTTNVREWRLVFRQRLAPAAHPQMRELMGLALSQLRNTELGVLFEDIKSPEL
jgi:thymidylate synthase (FAD)